MYTEKAIKFRKSIDNASKKLTDEQALESIELYREWDGNHIYEVGDRVRDIGYLFKRRQPQTAPEIYHPHEVPALWERVQKQSEGDHDNPIPFDASVGMALTEGLYYSEDGVLYRCFRSSGAPIYNRLADLIEIYVRVSNS